jgi:hypothetical protein
MSGSIPTDDLDRVFRSTYQTVVDQTPLPGDALPAAPLIGKPQRRSWGPLVALAVAVAVLAFGGIAVLTRDSNQFAGPVERLALVEAPASLGGEPVVTLAMAPDSIEYPPLPSSEMWIWNAEDGVSSSVALFEVELGADTGDLIGRTEGDTSLVTPDAGEVAREVIPEFGWHVASWTADDRWRIVVGFDEEGVGRLAQLIGDNDPSAIDIEGRELAYQGPQILRAPEEASTPSLIYDTPAGQFGVTLALEWGNVITLARLSYPDLRHLEVNGVPAVSVASTEMISEGGEGESGQVRTIVWQIDETTTGWVFGIDMPEDLLLEIAEAVRPVSIEEWEEIAATSTEEGLR